MHKLRLRSRRAPSNAAPQTDADSDDEATELSLPEPFDEYVTRPCEAVGLETEMPGSTKENKSSQTTLLAQKPQ